MAIPVGYRTIFVLEGIIIGEKRSLYSTALVCNRSLQVSISRTCSHDFMRIYSINEHCTDLSKLK